jgi:uncharacterized protein YcaQ
MRINLDHLRRYAVARSLFKPTTLGRAISKLGFVQADPIRAPARAQDLTLRHRVKGYVSGDLDRAYSKLPIEEDLFVNYGYLPRGHRELMHPRVPRQPWTAARSKQAQAVLTFVREQGAVHPALVDAHFAHGKIRNWFGGVSNASTRLLEEMHLRGMLRVARREGGIRIYAAARLATGEPAVLTPEERFDALADIMLHKYAPVPGASLGMLSSLLARAVPQWRSHRAAALVRAKQRLICVRVDGIDWYWPKGESPASSRWHADDSVRLLTPFDPVVWDRRRFRLLWNWDYRFEAYTPAPRRKLGYYAMPLLWRDQVIGWGNLSVREGKLHSQFGYIGGRPPREPAFAPALEAELAAMRRFLRLV